MSNRQEMWIVRDSISPNEDVSRGAVIWHRKPPKEILPTLHVREVYTSSVESSKPPKELWILTKLEPGVKGELGIDDKAVVWTRPPSKEVEGPVRHMREITAEEDKEKQLLYRAQKIGLDCLREIVENGIKDGIDHVALGRLESIDFQLGVLNKERTEQIIK